MNMSFKGVPDDYKISESLAFIAADPVTGLGYCAVVRVVDLCIGRKFGGSKCDSRSNYGSRIYLYHWHCPMGYPIHNSDRGTFAMEHRKACSHHLQGVRLFSVPIVCSHDR